MPLTRYQIRNEYGLADPELYRAADRDDPEALLEGVAMAGLVGVLRQLGDLAEFAAEIFHDLHEEVMVTAARGHGLMARVQQLEAEFPSIEKVFLSQTNHTPFFANAGVDWHPNLHMEQNLIARGDLPRFVMDSYEECRGPPRLFLLDKFDVAGAGACLKRYTDPSFFKVEAASTEMTSVDVQKEKRSRKIKKKGHRGRNGETPEVMLISHAKLHQLFLEEQVENGHSDPARLVKLKRRQLNGSPFDLKPAKSYMEKFLQTPSPEHKLGSSESGLDIVEIGTVSPVKESLQGNESMSSSPNTKAIVLIHPSDVFNDEDIDKAIVEPPDRTIGRETDESHSIIHDTAAREALDQDEDDKTDGTLGVDDMASEVDNYMDALASMESEMETDNEHKNNKNKGYFSFKKFVDNDANGGGLDIQANFSDSVSTGNCSLSDDGSTLSKKGRSVSSYSNSFGDLAENFIPDEVGGPQLSRSFQYSSAQNVLQPEKQIVVVKTLGTIPQEDAVLDDKNAKSSNPLEASCNPSLTDSGITPLPSLSVPADLKEFPSKIAECQFKLPDAEKGWTNLADSSRDIHSQVCHDTSIFSSESHHVHGLDHEDEKPSSDAFVQTSNVELGFEKNCNGDSVNHVIQTKHADEAASESLCGVSRLIDISVREGKFSCLPEVEIDSGMTISSDNLSHSMPDFLVSSVDNISSMKNYSSTVASPSKSSDTLKPDNVVTGVDHVSETESNIQHEHTDGTVSQVEPESSVVPSSEEKTKFDISDSIEERGEIAGSKEVVREYATTSPCSSHYLDKDNLQDQLDANNSVAEIVQEKNAAVPTTAIIADDNESAATASTSVSVSGTAKAGLNDSAAPSTEIDDSSSGNLMNLLKPSSEGEHVKDVVAEESVSPECLAKSYAQSELQQIETAPTDLDPDWSESISDHKSKSNLEENGQVDNPSVEEQVHDNPDIGEVVIGQSSEPNNQKQSKSSYRTGDKASFSPTCYAPEAENSLDQPMQLGGAKIIADSFCADEAISKSQDISVSPSCEPGNSAERSLELLSDHLGEKLLLPDEAKTTSNASVVEFEQLPRSRHADQGNCLDTPKTYRQEFLPQLDSLKTNGEILYRNPFDSYNFPGFRLPPEGTSTNPEGMPPLPPLPPIQWRRGKVQHDEKGPLGIASSNTEIGLPLKPSFVPNVLDSQRFEHLSVEPTDLSNSLSLENPAAVKDPNTLNDRLHLEASKSMNPILTSESVLEDDDGQVLHASVKEPTPYRSNLLSPTSMLKRETLAQEIIVSNGLSPSSLNEKAPETALETQAADDSLQNLEERTSPDKKSEPVAIAEERHEHDLLTSSGEMMWPMTYELGKLTGNKLPRPRNPLIDAVAAHDKSKMRKVTERVRPEIEPKADERDSLLEQIRTKSFNLKPASVTRPRPSIQRIQGPKTNWKVAAILEKKAAIRQATAGSDEDEDTDSWSDS